MSLSSPVNQTPGAVARLRALVEERLGGDLPLASGAFWIFCARVVGAGSSYLAQVLLARWLGADQYGVFVYGWLWLSMVGIVAPLGADAAVQRLLPAHRGGEDWAKFWGAFWFGFLLVGLSGLGLGALGYVLADQFGALLGEVYRPVLMIAALALPFWALNEQFLGVGRAVGWPLAAYTPYFVLMPLLLVASAGVLLLLGWAPDSITAMSAGLAACVLTFVISLALILPRARAAFPKAKPDVTPRPWFGLAFSLLLVTGSQVLLESTDVVVIGAFMAPEHVAVYFAALRTAGLMGFVYFAVAGFAVPRFAMLHASGDSEAMHQFVRQATRLIFWPSVAAALGLLALGKLFLGLFGDDFADGYGLMAVLMAGFLFKAAIGPVDQLLGVSGSHRLVAMVLVATALLNVALNITLIPVNGTYGAALATVISIMVSNTVLAVAMVRRLGIRPFLLEKPSRAAGAAE